MVKQAKDLEGGDVILDSFGESLGVVLDDPYVFKGYDGVEFDVMKDDVQERVRVPSGALFDVRPWRGSGAV